uniref:Myb/SANT-like domain-containing protein n=1 Tax=Setaria italica TaxID=4555 RepID=K3ZLD9_SETIT
MLLCTQMALNRANWDEGTTKTLLDLCIAEKNQFNWSNRCLTKLGWKHVYRSFNQQTGMNLASKQLQNKLNALRRAFLSWRALQTQSGLGRDKQTGGVDADPSFWEDEEAETSAGAAQTSSQPSSFKPPPFLDELYELYGHEPQDRGTLLMAGGICEATPSVGTEGNAQDLYQDPCLLKRGDREQEEMDRAMQLIEEDGLQEGSPLYYQALYLCTRNPGYRRAFTKMKTKEGRLNWIQFNWDMLNK